MMATNPMGYVSRLARWSSACTSVPFQHGVNCSGDGLTLLFLAWRR